MRNTVCLYILLAYNVFEKQVNSQATVPNSIPDYLLECYSNSSLRNRAFRLPSTIGTLISLLQKAERSGHTEKLKNNVGGVLDARVMSYSILHRFRMDGIERVPNIPNVNKNKNENGTSVWDGIIPYAATGLQFQRYKILFGELIPGNAILFPNSTLESHEKCALHFMLSSTVDLWERGDEGITCRGAQTLKPTKLNMLSECPLEDGVVAVHSPYSSRSDTISPGTVIAGIAAALQLQEVSVAQLKKFGDNIMSKVPDGDPDYHDLDDVPPVSNIWAATLAGDLSEVAIFQGPYKMTMSAKERETMPSGIVVGVDGWWGGGPNISAANNIYTIDSRLGRWYYLMRNRDLEITDAEIRGGIDGLLLGSAVIKWSSSVKGRMRLSQILEMYYSEKGMTAYGDPDLKWCNRLEYFIDGFGAGGSELNEKNVHILEHQTMSFARILYEKASTGQFEDHLLQEFVDDSVRKFLRYLTNQIDYQHCANGYYGRDEELPGYPYADIYVVTDGSWGGHNYTTLMAYLAEECDVSLFGSRMSVMNGRTAKWIVDHAISAAEVTYNITKEINEQTHKVSLPGLDIVQNFAKFDEKINEQINFERIRNVIKGIRPQVILFLAHRSLILGAGIDKMMQTTERFLRNNPDVHVVFASVDSAIGAEDPFSKLGGLYIRTTGNMASDIIPAVLPTLRMVPRRMISHNCDERNTQSLGATTQDGDGYLEFEDYLSPGEPKDYRLHPMYFKKTQDAKIVFEGSGYGEVSICMTRHRPDEPRSMVKAACVQMISGNAEFALKDPCPGGEPYNHGCLPIYFRLNATKTFGRCTEDDCRFPDQVRFSVRHQNLKCSGSMMLTASTFTPACLLLLLASLRW